MKRSGQVLTELLVALSVVIIGVLALVQLATKSISNSGFSRRQSEATSYGASGADWVRSQRDVLGWDTFAAKAGPTYCINDLMTWTTGPCVGQIGMTGFSREVTLTTIDASKLEATITVKWTEGGKVFSSKQTTIFGRYTQSSLNQTAPTPTPTPTPTPPTCAVYLGSCNTPLSCCPGLRCTSGSTNFCLHACSAHGELCGSRFGQSCCAGLHCSNGVQGVCGP